MLRYFKEDYSEFVLNIGIRAKVSTVFKSFTRKSELETIGFEVANFYSPSGLLRDAMQCVEQGDILEWGSKLWSCGKISGTVAKLENNECISFQIDDRAIVQFSFEAKNDLTIVRLHRTELGDVHGKKGRVAYWLHFWAVFLISLKSFLEHGIRFQDLQLNEWMTSQYKRPSLNLVTEKAVRKRIRKTGYFNVQIPMLYDAFTHPIDLERWVFQKVWTKENGQKNDFNNQFQQGDTFDFLINVCYDIKSSAKVVTLDKNKKVVLSFENFILLEVNFNNDEGNKTRIDTEFIFSEHLMNNSFDYYFTSLACTFWLLRLKAFLEYNIDISFQEVLNPNELNVDSMRA